MTFQLDNTNVILALITFFNLSSNDPLKTFIYSITYVIIRSWIFVALKKNSLYLKNIYLYSIFTLFAICELINKVNSAKK